MAEWIFLCGVWYADGMDKSTICSMALNAVGKADYATGTPGSAACDLYLGQVYGELLAAHDWSFARRRVVLEVDEGGEFVMPPDCLRIVELRGLKNWRVYGTRIRPELGAVAEGEVELVYTSSQLADRGELPDRCRAFARALVMRLAEALASAVVHDERKASYFAQEARVALHHAMTLDTQQDNSNDQHPLAVMLGRGITNSGF